MVEKQIYEDLDEIIYRFIVPMCDYGREIQSHRLFLAESRDSVAARLRQERDINPSRIPYFIFPSPEQPRCLNIGYFHRKPHFEVRNPD